jgi:hypothetical protein
MKGGQGNQDVIQPATAFMHRHRQR